MSKLYPYLDLALIAMAALITLYFTVETPSSDDWDLVPILQEMHQGTLNLTTLDTPYAGHKMDVSYIVMGAIAYVTRWNSYILHLVNILFLLGGWLAIRPFALKAGRLLSAAVFYWSWNQWAAWVWTWMIADSLAIFCVLWSVRLLNGTRWRQFVLAMILAVLGTFSYGGGLAIWPAGLYLMFVKPRPLSQRIIFGMTLLLALVLFLHHPVKSAAGLTHGQNYLRMPLYFLMAVGAPAGFATYYFAAAAAIIGLMMLFAGRPPLETIKSQPFIVSLFVVSLGMLALLVIARGGGDSPIAGMDPRYGAMSALFWVALVMLVDWTGWRRYVLLLLVALCLVRSLTTIRTLTKFKQHEVSGINGLLRSTPDRFLLKGHQTSSDEFDADAKLMRQWHYSLFKGG